MVLRGRFALALMVFLTIGFIQEDVLTFDVVVQRKLNTIHRHAALLKVFESKVTTVVLATQRFNIFTFRRIILGKREYLKKTNKRTGASL
jgi:hypothetical protein